MCAPNKSLGHGDRAGGQAVDPEELKSDASSNDVDDGVDGTDLVEGYVVYRHPMYLGFCLRKGPEYLQAPLPHPLRKRRLLDQLPNVGPAAVGMVAMVVAVFMLVGVVVAVFMLVGVVVAVFVLVGVAMVVVVAMLVVVVVVVGRYGGANAAFRSRLEFPVEKDLDP